MSTFLVKILFIKSIIIYLFKNNHTNIYNSQIKILNNIYNFYERYKMASGTKTVKDFTTHSIDIKQTLLPSIVGLADGTYSLSIVVASGVPTLVLTEPASDQTLTISGLTSFSIKNGVVTAKV